MNEAGTDDSLGVDESQLRAILIANCQLSSDGIEQISTHMQASGRSFGESALQLGLVSSVDIEDARAWARRPASRGEPGVVEAAIHKVSGRARRMLSRIGHQVRPGRDLVIVHEPYSARSETLRALRTELMLLADGANRAVNIAIVSPLPGEGRSQLAAELAVAFAQLGRSTILVDADLRNPRQHQLFDATDPMRGLAQAIAGRTSPYVHAVQGFEQLHLVAAGGSAPNPLELLSDSYFRQLVGDWSGSYHFVIIDTPPVSAFADGLAVATVAGRALVVNRAAHTPYDAMKELLRRLATAESQLLGAVLNRF
jgi:receptor protein-tyrosine kinase